MRHRIASYNEGERPLPRTAAGLLRAGSRTQTRAAGQDRVVRIRRGHPEQYEVAVAQTKAACEHALRGLPGDADAGIAREVARTVLPVGTYSSMYVTMNARALMNFLSLRTKREDSAFRPSRSERSRWWPTGWSPTGPS